MLPNRSGSFHFFTFRGIDVSIHWMWFLVAAYQIQYRSREYTSPLWNVYEYLALFAIVLMHEFGHALACRQVGGTADRIVLWPLGGVAFVSPPQRPGAILWSIAAGPLVNVALIPVFHFGLRAVSTSAWASPDLVECVWMLRNINYGLLIFNMLPVYPLDGGQILQSLLWFVMGRARSLFVVTIIGALAAFCVLYFAWQTRQLILGLIGIFILMQCKSGFQLSRALSQMDRAQR
jgi:Zn-dependent protease